MRTRRLSVITVGLLVVGAALGGCGQSASPSSSSTTAVPTTPTAKATASLFSLLPDTVRASKQLVAGSELSVPPMIFYASNGTTIEGVNYDLGQAMAKELGVSLSWKQFGFPGLQPALQAGKINMIFDVLNDTAAREASMTFIDYMIAGTSLLIQHANPHHISGITSLCGLRVAEVQGAVQNSLITQQSRECVAAGKPVVTAAQYPSAPTARLQVQNGRADAFIGNEPVLLYVARTANGGNLFSSVPVTNAPRSYYGIAIPKSSGQLGTALTDALSKVIASGQYARILSNWGLTSLAVQKPLINAATAG